MKILITENQFFSLFEDNSESSKLSKDEFVRKAQEIHKNEDGSPKYQYDKVNYINSTTPIIITCPKHGDFPQRPFKHIQKEKPQGCRECYKEGKRAFPDEELRNLAKKYQSTTEFSKLSPREYYSAAKRPKFYREITSHFTGKERNESQMEKLVAEFLVSKNLISESCLNNKNCGEREKTFEGCFVMSKNKKRCFDLYFDFYIPSLNLIIEVDGEQHFITRESSKMLTKTKLDKTVFNDKLKNQYCLNNNIKIIRMTDKISAKQMEQLLDEGLNKVKTGEIYLLGDYPKLGWNSPK